MLLQPTIFTTLLVSATIAAWLPQSGRLSGSLLHHVFRHFGSGVIVATAMLHLLGPSLEALAPITEAYPLALLLCLASLFSVLIIEIVARRLKPGPSEPFGTPLHCIENVPIPGEEKPESPSGLIPLLVMEVGIVLHSVFIGLSLAMSGSLGLAIAIHFHQFFEGLGLGARLVSLGVKRSHCAVVIALFGISTPLGLVFGLIASEHTTADLNVTAGICDALAAGVLMYIGIVELLAGEILNAPDLETTSTSDIVTALFSVFAGGAVMCLLALWI